MAIAFDAKTQGLANTSSPQSYAHTCTGTDRILYVHIFLTGGAQTISAMTYNGVSMTQVASRTSGTGSTIYLYRLVNPASGSNNVSITFSATFSATVAVSFTGALQAGGTFVSATGLAATTLGVNVTPNSANNWISFAVGSDQNAPTALNSSFLRQVGADIAITAMDTNAAVTGLTTMGATQSGSPNTAIYGIAESFEPSGVAAVAAVPDRRIFYI